MTEIKRFAYKKLATILGFYSYKLRYKMSCAQSIWREEKAVNIQKYVQIQIDTINWKNSIWFYSMVYHKLSFIEMILNVVKYLK